MHVIHQYVIVIGKVWLYSMQNVGYRSFACCLFSTVWWNCDQVTVLQLKQNLPVVSQTWTVLSLIVLCWLQYNFYFICIIFTFSDKYS